MFLRAKPHPGEIPVPAALPGLPGDAWEVARFWVDGERSYVAIGRQQGWSPELLGSLLVESVRTAAATFATSGDISEEEALQRLWKGFDDERSNLGSRNPAEDFH